VRRDEGPVLHVKFADNSLLPLLFGEHDRFLAQIEQAFAVRVAARGNVLEIAGAAEAADAARHAFERLYERLAAERKRGTANGLSPADVDSAIRFASADDDAPARGIVTWKRTIEARSPGQSAYIDALAEFEIVFGIGPAGTGKTYIAVANAVSLLKAGKIDRIILSRPAVEAGERLGFLPGDMKEKIDPYLRPLYDALYEMMPGDQVDRRLQAGEIEIAPLAFMRGRTLSNAFVILDEAQNTTPTQMKMFLTRLGENSRMAVTGDPSQVDLPLGAKSGLVDAMDTLRDVRGITMIEFSEADVVRHPLVTRIVRAYNARDPRLLEAARPGEAKR